MLLIAIAGVVLWACQHERFSHSDEPYSQPDLTVSEAQQIFEQQYAESLPYMTKSTGDKPIGMTPGAFTPLWKKARLGATQEMSGADVPIDPEYIFVAVFREITANGDTIRRSVDVTQKLVVKKWRDTTQGTAFSYIATIVPTPDCYAKHKDIGKAFQYGGDKGDFSGFTIFYTLTGRLVGVDSYKMGQRISHHYFPNINKHNHDSIRQIVIQILDSVTIQSGNSVMYAIGTEEDPIITDDVTVVGPDPHDYCPICGFEYCICDSENQGENGNTNNGDGGTNPDYNDGDITGNGGKNPDNNPSNQNPSVSNMFNVNNLTDSQVAEINDILHRLSQIGISNKVLTTLIKQGKIQLQTGTLPGHENSVATYTKATNTITLNTSIIDADGLRNGLIEETFHAYQFIFYDNPNPRCMEFEARVYGTIVINRYSPAPTGWISYLNPFGSETPQNIITAFVNDLKIQTNNFTQTLTPDAMSTLFQDYGEYCTQYPAGNPDWEFKAIDNAQK